MECDGVTVEQPAIWDARAAADRQDGTVRDGADGGRAAGALPPSHHLKRSDRTGSLPGGERPGCIRLALQVNSVRSRTIGARRPLAGR
jgi:hypothetical protein